MSVDVEHPPTGTDPLTEADPHAPIPFKPPRRRRRRRPPDRPAKPRVRKLRLLAILIGLGALAFVSTVFGMMMSVASDLPVIENRAQYLKEANSWLYDDRGQPLGIFAPPNNVVIDSFQQISPYMRRAMVATEDRRFWGNPGVDIRGIARAFLSDIGGHSLQGASTIAEQFVKNALLQQNNRTIFEKLREAAMAFHLAHKWSKQKILTEYLNSIYFGNGAYGIESAARIYFGHSLRFYSWALAHANSGYEGPTVPPTCGDGVGPDGKPQPECASLLQPWQAALLAGMVANPSAYDPIANPETARERRNLVLKDMLQEQYISRFDYERYIRKPLPNAQDIQMPVEPTAAPYFTSWLRPQILAAMGLGHGVSPQVAEYRAYFGGLHIKTTLDLQLQQAADHVIASDLPYTPGGPAVSLVAIDNKTGEVRAMVGGPVGPDGHENFEKYPFNLATEGHRQPGSAFKPFTLAVALESGFTGSSLMESAPITFIVPHSGGKEKFPVRNFGNAYSGPISLAAATAVSDNSVYSRLGILLLKPHGGIPRIARMAHAMGIRSPLSENYAMILGGLTEGVTPVDMAHAYETFATGGKRVYSDSLGAPDGGPIGIQEIQCHIVSCGGKHDIVLKPQYKRVMPASVAKAVHDILEGVTHWGTATRAAISGVDVVGKTGTTSNYGDAWFVGWTPQITVAVWVGVPDKLVSMATDFGGQPVEGGTWPAIIWHDFVSQALNILATETPAKNSTSQPLTSTTSSLPGSTGAATTQTPTTGTPTTGTPTTGVATTPTTPAPGNNTNTGTGTTSGTTTTGTTGGAGLGGGGGGAGGGGGGGGATGTTSTTTGGGGGSGKTAG